jgi:hypothetical protein
VKDFLAQYYNIAMKKQEDMRMVERDVSMHKLRILHLNEREQRLF